MISNYRPIVKWQFIGSFNRGSAMPSAGFVNRVHFETEWRMGSLRRTR